ncbi:rRNA-binding ribosome biosynthesis protein [Hypoxylon texense]
MRDRPAPNRPLGPLASTDDEDILNNIDGRMHGPMSGFIKKYFGKFRHVHQDDFLEIQVAGKVSGRYAIPSAAPSPDNFLQWFSKQLSSELGGARGSWHISGGNVTPEYETADDGTCLLLTIPASQTSNADTRWRDVQVIGQFYRNSNICYQDGLLRLCRSAHQVFASQPVRLFLHGFYVRGSLIEFWVFDRSGLYCSEVFDIRKDFIQFLSVILIYQLMTDDDLGKSNMIESDQDGSYVVLDSSVTPSLGKLYLEDQPIASRERLVGTGTTCYRARMPYSSRWDYVLKFKWRWARDRPENELLELAKEKRVWGAISLGYYKEAESTANLRRSLRWGRHRKFSRVQKYGSEEQQQEHTSHADGLVEYTEETGDMFQNRVLTCVVTSPVGRPLHTFQSLSELLHAMRDAIKCHRSLLFDARILHQDISVGNIIIVDGREEDKPKGILIDLDSAVELAEGTSKDDGIDDGVVGTRPFIAIGVLKSERHSYRHDLESFLYVILWTIITNHTENLPETSKLRQWSNGSWDELAMRKSLDMNQDNFQTILEEFPPEFHSLKPLAESLRRILFPLRDGVFWTGSDSSPEAADKLYDEIISAFEKVIASERER